MRRAREVQSRTRRGIAEGGTDSTGKRSWVGVWRDYDGQQVKRVLGPVRVRGSPVGLSKTEAEQELRTRMSAAARRCEGDAAVDAADRSGGR